MKFLVAKSAQVTARAGGLLIDRSKLNITQL